MELLQGDIDPVAPGVLNREALGGLTLDGDGGESMVTAYAVVGVDHVVARRKLGCPELERLGPSGPAAAGDLADTEELFLRNQMDSRRRESHTA